MCAVTWKWFFFWQTKASSGVEKLNPLSESIRYWGGGLQKKLIFLMYDLNTDQFSDNWIWKKNHLKLDNYQKNSINSCLKSKIINIIRQKDNTYWIGLGYGV